MLLSNRKRVFMELNDKVINEGIAPDADESRKFWSEIWDNLVLLNHTGEWPRDIETELGRV